MVTPRCKPYLNESMRHTNYVLSGNAMRKYIAIYRSSHNVSGYVVIEKIGYIGRRHTHAGSRNVWFVVPVKEPLLAKVWSNATRNVSGVIQAWMVGFCDLRAFPSFLAGTPCIFCAGQETSKEVRVGSALVFRVSNRRTLL